jgi:hypothetical protein
MCMPIDKPPDLIEEELKKKEIEDYNKKHGGKGKKDGKGKDKSDKSSKSKNKKK